MSSINNPVAAVANSSGAPMGAQTTAPADPLGSESTFLTLLVSQLQNQDPLNPTDSTQFVSQLTGFSQLEQLINIDQNTTPASSSATPAVAASPAATTPPASTNANNVSGLL
jgi:flagellar basal-body rod modification protein FlgD